MQLKESLINLGIAIHNNSEVIMGITSFNLLMRVDISDELGHLAFSLGGSCISGILVWVIKKYLDSNADSLFNKYFKKNGKKNKDS